MDTFAIVPVEYNKEYLWCVFENTTQQVVNAFYFEDEARRYANFLRRGGAFAGYTPRFMVSEFF